MKALKLAVVTALGLGVAACQPGDPCYDNEEICALLAAKFIVGGILIASADEDRGYEVPKDPEGPGQGF